MGGTKTPVVQNMLKAMLFEGPEWIPCAVSIMPATWMRYGEAVEEIALSHPKLFPGYRQGQFRHMDIPREYKAGRWVDVWGTVWHNIEEGLASIPVEDEAPLKDWAAFGSYQPPDSLARTDLVGDPIDWGSRARAIQETKQKGGLAVGGFSHGFMYMRLFYLRGFSNLMMDIATRETKLDTLIQVVRDYNIHLARKWIEIGVEMVSGGDDLGLQRSLPVSPTDWRRYIKPSYEEIVGVCRDSNVYFYLHSDGHILEIIPDLIECGVTIINPQIRANGLEGLRRVAKGNVCVHLDLDRQLFPFATREEIEAHIHEAIDTLNSPKGGLMLHAECEPDVPLENIRAIVEALERYGCGPMH